MARWFGLLPLVLWCLVFVSPPALGLDPVTPLSQTNHYAWRVTDGVFRASPSSFAQTSDGYIWIGTRSGLYRFDGIRFSLFAGSGNAEPIRSPIILATLADRDGSLWIGTGSDLERWRDGKLTHYPSEPGKVLSYFLDIYQTRGGDIWVNRARKHDSDGPLCKVAGPQLVCYGRDQGVAADNLAGNILEDADGSLWTHSDQAIIHWDPKTLQALPGGMELHQGVDSVQALAFDSQSTLLVGLEGAELARLKDGALAPYPIAGLENEKISAQQLFYDSHKTLWIGTDKRGLYRISGSRVEHFGLGDGLSSDTIAGIGEDHEGNIWILTSQGVDRFRDQRVLTYSKREGLSADLVNAVAAGHDRNVWINNLHGVDLLRDGVIQSTAAPAARNVIYAIFEDRDGRLWMGIDKTLVIYAGGRFTPIDGSSASIGTVQAITQDPAGGIWAITWPGGPHAKLLHIEQDKIKEEFPFETLPIAFGGAIAPDPRNGVWVPLANGDVAHWHDGRFETIRLHRPPNSSTATGLVVSGDSVYESNSAGLVGWRNGRVQWLKEANGLPCRFVIAMVQGHDALWVSADCGIFSIANAELERWWQDPDATLHVSLFDSLDGAQPSMPALSPKAAVTTDGKIWFANHSVAQMIDPTRTVSNSLPPPVQIEQIVADRKSYSPSESIRLPPLTRDLQIAYAALSFVIPEKVRFRYRLVGHDDAWIDAQTRRQAFYTDLKPGSYRFLVTACNNDGVWNETGASVTFAVLPAFYQTRTFMVAGILLAAVILRALYVMRLRQHARRMRLNLEAKAIERERIARDLHDTLLQGIQGLIYKISSIAEQLPKAEPKRVAMEQALDRAESLLVQGRDQLTGMRREPAAATSLPEALATIAKDLEQQTDSEFELSVQGAARELTTQVRDEMYRIGAESLVNAFRHAAAPLIEVEILFDDAAITLRIRDNGKGFDEAVLRKASRPGHFGLLGLQERADRIGAVLEIWSREGAGTEVSCRVEAQRAYRHLQPTGLGRWLKRIWGDRDLTG
jgi:signal transduction histidine kinase/ligand-binding sensor domain-containing protein